jgi:hypothetical protein
MSNQQVVVRLRELEHDGRLQPSDVLADARNPTSPLHSHFEWDDGLAAERYRLSQARSLIRSVKIHVTVRDMPLSVVGYVRDPELQDTRDPGYRNVMQLRTEEDSARAAIVEEMKRVANAARRARSLAAVLGLTDQIDEINRIAESVSERVSLMTPAAPAASA